MTVDPRLLKHIRAFVDESLRLRNADPFEMADYMFDLYKQHDRLDVLTLMARQLIWREYNG